MIPADAPPSFDGHKENTYATLHATAPFYSTLIAINPDNPASSTDFVCDLCTEMPIATDDGKTYTFKIRKGVKFHDGTPLTAADVATSWQYIVHPPKGVSSARESYMVMVDTVESPDPETVVFKLKFATGAFLPALADPFAYIYKKETLEKDPPGSRRTSWGRGPSSSCPMRPASRSRACAIPTTTTRASPISTASSPSSPPSSRCASMPSAPTAPPRSSAACRRRRATSWSRSWATRSRCRPATGTA